VQPWGGRSVYQGECFRCRRPRAGSHGMGPGTQTGRCDAARLALLHASQGGISRACARHASIFQTATRTAVADPILVCAATLS